MNSRRSVLRSLLGLLLVLPLVGGLLRSRSALRTPTTDPLRRLGVLKLAEEGDAAVEWAERWVTRHCPALAPALLRAPGQIDISAVERARQGDDPEALEPVSGWLLPAPLVALAILRAVHLRS